jgi:hypothetical protein
VRAASEAVRAAWLTPERAGDVDASTRHAFAMFARVRDDGARVGRVVSAAPPTP